jgi:hypothetical protein
MPILLRAARVADLTEGECRSAKVRGRRLWICATPTGASVFGSRCAHSGAADSAEPCVHYRSQVRGGFVWVALDPVANAAPADVHLNDRAPRPTGS